MPNTYLVKVTGEVYVGADSHSDVRECLSKAQLECPGSRIRFLDIERIQLVPEVAENSQGETRPHPHPHE